jgi:SAM-dependent methyltransferase
MLRIEAKALADARDQAELVAAIAAAAQVGVFEALRAGPASAAEVAGRAGLDARATRVVLAFLADAGVLDFAEGRYRPAPGARAALCDPEAPGYAAGGLPHWLGRLRDFTQLGEVLRSGVPARAPDAVRDQEGLRRFAAAMAAAPRARVERIVELCLSRNPGARSALDVGGGPGHMSRVFVERGLRTTLLDTPETVAFVGREYGLSEVAGLDLVGADFLEDPLPPGPYDVVLISNVLHIYGPEENQALLRKAAAASGPGGLVAIVDFVGGRSPRASRFALLMLLGTERGDAWSEADYRAWLDHAGFTDVRVDDVDADRQMVSGVRRGR